MDFLITTLAALNLGLISALMLIYVERQDRRIAANNPKRRHHRHW